MGRSPWCSREGLYRGAWTAQEDMILSEYIRNHGDRGWRNISKKAGLNRCQKSCRSRWFHYLRPDIKRGNISPDEEELIIRMHRLLGNRWSLIAGRLPGRTDNEIKNYWNTRLKKKQKLLTDECQQKTHNLKIRPESRPPLQYQMVTANSGSNNGGFKMCNIQETKNFSKTLCDLFVDDSIREDDSESMAFRRPDADLVEPEAKLQQSLFSNHFTGLGLEDFYSSGPVTSLDVERNGFEHESNMQQVNSITLPDDQRLKDFYDSTEPVDWNHVLDYIVNSTIAVKNP